MAQKVFQGHSVESGLVLVHIQTRSDGTSFHVRDNHGKMLEQFETPLKGGPARTMFRFKAWNTFTFMRVKSEASYTHERMERLASLRKSSTLSK